MREDGQLLKDALQLVCMALTLDQARAMAGLILAAIARGENPQLARLEGRKAPI